MKHNRKRNVPSADETSDWILVASNRTGRNTTVTAATGARSGDSRIDGANEDPPCPVRLATSLRIELTPPVDEPTPDRCRNASVRTTRIEARTMSPARATAF